MVNWLQIGDMKMATKQELIARFQAIKASPFKFEWSEEYKAAKYEIDNIYNSDSFSDAWLAAVEAQVAKAEKPAKKAKRPVARRGYAMPDSDDMRNFDA